MREKESGFEAEFIIPWMTLMAPNTANEVVKAETPIVKEASMTTIPKKNFLLTWSEILPAISPKEAYGSV